MCKFKGWIKIRQQFDIPVMTLVNGVQHLCTFSIVSPVIYRLLLNVWKRHKPIARPSLLICFYCPIARISLSLVLYWVPRSGSFTSRRDHNRMGTLRWMFQNLPLPAAQEVRDSSSGVTRCIVMKNDTAKCRRFSRTLDEGDVTGTCSSRQCLSSALEALHIV